MIAWRKIPRRPAVIILLPLFAVLPLCAQTQEGSLDKAPPKSTTVQDVIQRFTANEKEWKQVREQYSFQQSIKVQTLSGLEVVGEYRQVAEVRYTNGQRTETILLAPQASIPLSKEDMDDLNSRASFTVSTDELADYNLQYVGQQNEDELHCYVFDVAPKQIAPGRRYFEGRIWVDDRDLQIVKNRGKSVPDIHNLKKKKNEENLFPQFTTWREQVDGKYWFPTYSSADDTLHFETSDVHLKQLVTLTDYMRIALAK